MNNKFSNFHFLRYYENSLKIDVFSTKITITQKISNLFFFSINLNTFEKKNPEKNILVYAYPCIQNTEETIAKYALDAYLFQVESTNPKKNIQPVDVF